MLLLSQKKVQGQIVDGLIQFGRKGFRFQCQTSQFLVLAFIIGIAPFFLLGVNVQESLMLQHLRGFPTSMRREVVNCIDNDAALLMACLSISIVNNPLSSFVTLCFFFSNLVFEMLLGFHILTLRSYEAYKRQKVHKELFLKPKYPLLGLSKNPR